MLRTRIVPTLQLLNNDQFEMINLHEQEYLSNLSNYTKMTLRKLERKAKGFSFILDNWIYFGYLVH